jgi:hypothetical protein
MKPEGKAKTGSNPFKDHGPPDFKIHLEEDEICAEDGLILNPVKILDAPITYSGNN